MKFDEKSPTTIEGNRRAEVPLDRLRDREAAGLVLPIGGVKEKVLAARRAGLTRVILPIGNKKDLRDLPTHVRQEMQFHFVERVEEILSHVIPNIQVKPLALAS